MSEPKSLVEGDKFKHLKHRLPSIKTLAMLKMEKNFIAHIEKGYPRQPYDSDQSVSFLIGRIHDELNELYVACNHNDVPTMKEECADISNLVDYLFEKLCREVF
jgi:NTP pyrophosphatase (non-canonical NTP hydrolase)